MALTLLLLMDDRKCFEEVRKMRWPDGVRCHKCGSSRVAKEPAVVLSGEVECDEVYIVAGYKG